MREVLLVLPDGSVISDVIDENTRHDYRTGEIIKEKFNSKYKVIDSMSENAYYACKTYNILVIFDDLRDTKSFIPEIPTSKQAEYLINNFADEIKNVHLVQRESNDEFKEIEYSKMIETLQQYIEIRRVTTVDPFGVKITYEGPFLSHDMMIYQRYKEYFNNHMEEVRTYIALDVLYPYSVMLMNTLSLMITFETNSKILVFIPKIVSEYQQANFELEYLNMQKLIIGFQKRENGFEFIGNSINLEESKRIVYEAIKARKEVEKHGINK